MERFAVAPPRRCTRNRLTTSRQQNELREAAYRQLVVRRRFTAIVMGFVVITTLLNALWTFTGTGSFWVTAPLSGLGAALVLHSWDIFPRRSITDTDIDAELNHERRA
jgi:hypothetical protein